MRFGAFKKLNNNEIQPQGDLQELPERYYIPEVKRMRLVLIAFAILYTFGFHPALGDINAAAFSFAFPALYIMSGYLVLRQSEDIEQRIRRAIGRTAICFVILFVFNLGASLILYKSYTLELLAQKTFWIDFLVFNRCLLPSGSTIWYVQALLYAYIIIYFICKLKLLKFDIYIAGACLVFTLLTGELASVVGFNFLGLSYFGGNFLTRALPYILIGCFIDRKKEYFSKLTIVKSVKLALIGIVLTVAEYLALNLTGNKIYTGHMLGMGLVAVVIALLPFAVLENEIASPRLSMLTRFELSIPFFVCSPIYALLAKVFEHFDNLFDILHDYMGLITLVASIVMLYIYFYLHMLTEFIIFRIYDLRERKKSDL